MKLKENIKNYVFWINTYVPPIFIMPLWFLVFPIRLIVLLLIFPANACKSWHPLHEAREFFAFKI